MRKNTEKCISHIWPLEFVKFYIAFDFCARTLLFFHVENATPSLIFLSRKKIRSEWVWPLKLFLNQEECCYQRTYKPRAVFFVRGCEILRPYIYGTNTSFCSSETYFFHNLLDSFTDGLVIYFEEVLSDDIYQLLSFIHHF